MTSTILELRQQDAPSYLDTPGEWTTTISKPIIIEEGDQIAMKSCFIDTQAQSNDRIVIANPIEVQIENGFYIDMVRPDAQDNTIINNVGYVADVNQGFVDGKSYILMDFHNTAPNSFYFPGMTVQTLHDAIGFMGDDNNKEAKGSITVRYFKPGATTTTDTTISLNDPKQYAPGVSPPGQSDKVTLPATISYFHNIIYDKSKTVPGYNSPMVFVHGYIDKPQNPTGTNSTEIDISSDGLAIELEQKTDAQGTEFREAWNYTLLDPQNPTVAIGNNVAVPHTKSDPELNSFIVPAGSYDPVQLCSVINRQIQLNTVIPLADYNKSYVNSNYLVAYNPNYPEFSGTNTETKFIAQDYSNVTQYTDASLTANANGAILVGASQMVLDYDQAAKQFMWSYIHQPYDGGKTSSGLVESAGVKNTVNLVANNNKPVSIQRNGGIYFTNFKQYEYIGNPIISKDGNGRLTISGGTQRHYDFLKEACGFNTPDLLTKITERGAKTFGTLAITKCHMPEDITVGLKTTSGYFGLDAIVDRADANEWWHPPAAGPDGFFSNITGMTIPIYNDEKSGGKDPSIDFGYYLIDVAAQFENEFTGTGYTSNNIRAIVSRYYEQNSYTIGSGADSMPYIHRGPPVVLSSMRCRILNGNKQVAGNLETDNTIMMEVIKPEKK